MAFLDGNFFLYTDRPIADDREPYVLDIGANTDDGNFYPSSNLYPEFPWITGHYDDSAKTIAFHDYRPRVPGERLGSLDAETTATYFTGFTMDNGNAVIAMHGDFQQVIYPPPRKEAPDHPVIPSFWQVGRWTATLLPTRFPFPLSDLLQEYTVIPIRH